MSTQSILVSIIIAVQNAGIDLQTTLESMKISRVCSHYELIIVDEGSIDGCCDFLLEFRLDKPIRKVKAGNGVSARQLGAEHALGQYLVFCSPRLYFENGWLERLITPLEEGRADCTSPVFTSRGRISDEEMREFPEGTLLESVLKYRESEEFDEDGFTPWLSSDCFAIRADTFEKLGGFEQGFFTKRVETAEFALRAWLLGYTCRVVPEVCLTLVFRHNFPPDPRKAFWGSDLITMARLHFDDALVEELYHLTVQCGGEHTTSKARENLLESRNKYRDIRQHDEHWFFQRFGITI